MMATIRSRLATSIYVGSLPPAPLFRIASLSPVYISSSPPQKEYHSGGDADDQSNVHIVFIEAKETND
jgi:hypothetical protein